MDPIVSIKPVLALAVSAIAAVCIIYARKNPNLRESFSLGAGVLKFLIVVSMAPVVLAGGAIEYTLVTIYPGVSISFKVDALGLMFAGTASFLWILASLYSIGYMRGNNEKSQTRFYACFAIALSSTMGVAFASNIFTLFLFYEILSVSTYPLVMHKETKEAREGGKMYVIYLVGASKSFFLAAMILTYMLTGTLDFARGGMFEGISGSTMLTAIYILYILGIAKAGIMPMHNWLPAAMVAPTPVSALLHAVAVVKVGVFSVLRIIFDVFGVDLMHQLHLGFGTAVVVSFTILLASTYALTQDNLKIRLAYSTVSQLSYVILGAALLTKSGVTGGVMHVAVHAFSKITLFFCAGAIYIASHKTLVSELNGIAKKMPYTMTAFAIGALSMIGVPPVAGFISKWYLLLGTLEAEHMFFLFVLVTSTMLNAAYFLPILNAAFFKDLPSGETAERQEAPLPAVIALCVTATAAVTMFFAPSIFLDLTNLVIDSLDVR